MPIVVNGTTITKVQLADGTEMVQVYAGEPHSSSNLVHCAHSYGNYQDYDSSTHIRYCGRPNCSQSQTAAHSGWAPATSTVCTGHSFTQTCSACTRTRTTNGDRAHSFTGSYLCTSRTTLNGITNAPARHACYCSHGCGSYGWNNVLNGDAACSRVWMTTSNNHWYFCSVCSTASHAYSHNWNYVSSDNNNNACYGRGSHYCTTCGYVGTDARGPHVPILVCNAQCANPYYTRTCIYCNQAFTQSQWYQWGWDVSNYF